MSKPEEPFVTVQQLAAALGVKPWHVQRAAKRGDLPYYTLFNSRKRFLLSEVLTAINAKRSSAADEKAAGSP